MKQYLLIITLLMTFLTAKAQSELSAFNLTGSGYSTTTANDYQCLGINPGNLGWTWNNRSINLGLLESGFSIYAAPLTSKQVVNDMFNNSLKLTMAERKQAAQDFTDKLISANVAFTWLGISYQDDKIGGFAFAIRERITWNSSLNGYGARFLFLGFHDSYFDSLVVNGQDTTGYSKHPQKASSLYQGTTQSFLWAREYDLGYGRIIIDKEKVKWYGGIDFKYMTIFAGTQYHDATSDGTVGFSALSPLFDVNYSEPTPSMISGNGLKKVGWGWGIDIGTSLLLFDKLRIGLALNDIGQIKYTGNVYTGQDTHVGKITSAGISNYNIFQQGQLISADNTLKDSAMWQGLSNKTFANPMNFRAGVSYQIVKQLEVGTDFLIPVKMDVPGAYEKMIFGLGCRYDPAKWVELSLGVVSGGKFGTNMPFGVTFFPVKGATIWQLGFATRDLITFFNPKTPTVSLAMGFLRFSFGNKRETNTATPQ